MSLTDEDKQWMTGAIASSQQQTVEAMRDTQTEILKRIEAFPRGNFARMHRLEASGNLGQD